MKTLNVAAPILFLPNEINPVARIMNAKTISDLNEQTNIVFDKLSDFQKNLKQNNISVRVDEIEDYIKAHAHEADLSATKICQKFDITPSYFSRIFKKETGKNLPEYLHRIRVERAKKLLADTDFTIYDIAEKSGFYNSRSLNRVFKDLEGKTPGQYRQENS